MRIEKYDENDIEMQIKSKNGGILYDVIRKPDNKVMDQGSNLYVYAINNPIIYYDSSGLKVTVKGIEGSIGLGATSSGGAYYVCDDKGNEGIMITAGLGGGVELSGGLGYMVFPDMDNIYELGGVGFAAAVSALEYSNANGYDGYGVSASAIPDAISGSVSVTYSWVYDLPEWMK